MVGGKEMREIKFRGIEKYHFACDEDRPKTMLYGAGLIQDSVNTWLIDNPSRKSLALGMTKTIIEPETVGQYTGLKDGNGQEVYEGDIVQYKSLKAPNDHNIIIFYKGSFGYFVGLCDPYFVAIKETYQRAEYWEIIGNIHENGDLLK